MIKPLILLMTQLQSRNNLLKIIKEIALSKDYHTLKTIVVVKDEWD